MSTTTLRYYKSTLSYQPQKRERKIRNFSKQFKTRFSRRRFRQSVQSAMRHFNHS